MGKKETLPCLECETETEVGALMGGLCPSCFLEFNSSEENEEWSEEDEDDDWLDDEDEN